VPAKRWWVLVAIVLFIGIGSGVAAWMTKRTPRTRQYTSFSVCMLTDDHGLAGTQAAAAWAGMQRMSQDTHAMVSYLAVPGPQTVANSLPYMESLVRRRCRVIVAVGKGPLAAVPAAAEQAPRVRFLAVGGHLSTPNVNAVGDETLPAIRRAVASLATEASKTNG
jgi:basic membrane lipoprotein Med (substrate-binding protein (PBP1-ABC) superfamily)